MKAEIKNIVTNICEEHLKNLTYKIEFSSQCRYIGKCVVKRIDFKPYYILRFSEFYFNYFYDTNDINELKDTVLHEVAHALAHDRFGRNQNHNNNWKKTAIEIGCSGKVRISIPVSAYKYVYECPVCKQRFHRLRKLNKKLKYYCKKCEDKNIPIVLIEEHKHLITRETT